MSVHMYVVIEECKNSVGLFKRLYVVSHWEEMVKIHDNYYSRFKNANESTHEEMYVQVVLRTWKERQNADLKHAPTSG